MKTMLLKFIVTVLLKNVWYSVIKKCVSQCY